MLNILLHQKGVTLVELMIGIAVIGILLVMGVSSYRDWIQNTQIRTAAESVQNGLQLARAEAVRRNTQVSFTLTSNNWSVAVVAPAAIIQSRSGTEGSTNALISTTPAGTSTLTFNGLGRITPATSVTISVTNPTGGTCAPTGNMRCLNVMVLSSGQARMCDPALPSTNPQSCSG